MGAEAVSLWTLRTEVGALRREYRSKLAELRAAEAERARAKMKGLGPQQRAVLSVLCEEFHHLDWRAHSFRGLSSLTGLTRAQVQRACKGLRRLGFAKLEIGLWDEDGEPRGAGYRATREGEAFLASLPNHVKEMKR